MDFSIGAPEEDIARRTDRLNQRTDAVQLHGIGQAGSTFFRQGFFVSQGASHFHRTRLRFAAD